MRIDIGPGPMPALEGLEEYDLWASERGLIVSRHYQWAFQDDDGVEWPGFWYVALSIERKASDGKIWVYSLSVNDGDLRLGIRASWEHLAEMLEASFQRMLEENNVTLEVT